MNETSGKVYLVGAGPGDPSLLTLKAHKLINTADIIIYDRLVSEDIMNLIPDRIEKIDVGKNSGNHKVPQDEINKIILNKALEGKNVVRLKGGDPFIFGRGGEELELLIENKIEFEVVPGITSAIATATYGGIPVTHRDFSSSLHIITGHARENGELNIDFSSLVKLNGTLVFLMSVANIEKISLGLINAGMDKSMPCAVIENGTRTFQRKFVSTVGEIDNVVKKNSIVSPSTIIVGKVCSLSSKFDWFDELQLKNLNILVTRPKKNSAKLSERLMELGANIREYPCLEIYPMNVPSINFTEYSWMIFTSETGVDIFFNDLYNKNIDARSFNKMKFAVVGKQTGMALRKFGIIPDFTPSIYDGEHLGKELLENGLISKLDKVIIFRAKDGAEELTAIFKENNVNFLDIPIYKTACPLNKNIDLKDFGYVTFTSESCVKGFIKSHNYINNLKAICIGKKTSDLAKISGFNTYTSKIASIDSMIDKILEVYRDDNKTT